MKKPKTSQSSKTEKGSKKSSRMAAVDDQPVDTNDVASTIKPRNKRKKATDFFEEEEIEIEPEQTPPKKAKKSAEAKGDGVPLNTPVPAEEDAQEDVGIESEDQDADDQSAALLQGFESSSEEATDAEDEEGITEVPAVPMDKKLAKKLKAAPEADNDGPGVLYVG